MEYREFIVNTLKEVSKIALGYFGKVSGVTKPDDNNQVLTDADLAIGKKIISLIQEKYPTHNIIDEEAGVIDNKSEFTWVIDPIDGTSNFANGVVTYGIIIGLLRGEKPIAGGFALPAFSEIYSAEKSEGAFLNEERITIINDKEKLSSQLLAYGIDANHKNPDATRQECKRIAELVLNIRNLRGGGCVFDSAMVLRNKYGAYIADWGKVWDIAGVQIIVEEADGVCTDYWGNPVNYKNVLARANEKYGFCISSPKLHEQIQKIISRVN